MDTWTTSRGWTADVAALAAGVVTALLVTELVGTVLFTRTFEQGPLAVAVASPAALAAGIGVGLLVRRALSGGERHSPTGVALLLGSAAFIAVGGAFGVYADVSASPFRDLVMSALLGLGAGAAVAAGTYRHLDIRERPERALRTLLAAVTAVAAALLGALVLFVVLTTLLDPHIWPAPIVTGPVALVAGLVFGVVAYRAVAGRTDAA
jgi:drug/metabolite transporter (DMT)-like permease